MVSMLSRFKEIKPQQLLALILGIIPIVLGLYLIDENFYRHFFEDPLVVVDLILLFLVLIAFINNPGKLASRVMFTSALVVLVLLIIKTIGTYLIEEGHYV